ncbi:MAG: fumarylacetoacetate hydrolase family protein [Alphaproteobacteria bacterium]|nr:fumarylacetoacetate hydrolase family protein [Alphaproteobacteria bacterium]
MKLLRFGPKGQEKPGLLDANGRIRDLSDKINDLDGAALDPDRLSALAKIDTASLPLVEGNPRLGPPVTGVGKIVAVGINYKAHGEEAKMDIPDEPILFTKAVTSLSGPNDPVVLPKGSKKGDWEVELAVVIGRRAQYVSQSEALGVIAGYSIMNDVSEREYQLERDGQWLKGKSFDTFAPLGPWLVTPDEVSDPQNLNLWLEVNGDRRQDGNTSSMIFGIGHIISSISSYMTLMPGDVIPTGTPPGVGLGRVPPMYLKPGDVMRLGVEGLGEQTQQVKAWEDVN